MWPGARRDASRRPATPPRCAPPAGRHDTAIIDYLDPSVSTTRFMLGPQVQTMSDQEIPAMSESAPRRGVSRFLCGPPRKDDEKHTRRVAGTARLEGLDGTFNGPNSPTSAPNQPLGSLNRRAGACFPPFAARAGGDFRFLSVPGCKISEKHQGVIPITGRRGTAGLAVSRLRLMPGRPP